MKKKKIKEYLRGRIKAQETCSCCDKYRLITLKFGKDQLCLSCISRIVKYVKIKLGVSTETRIPKRPRRMLVLEKGEENQMMRGAHVKAGTKVGRDKLAPAGPVGFAWQDPGQRDLPEQGELE